MLRGGRRTVVLGGLGGVATGVLDGLDLTVLTDGTTAMLHFVDPGAEAGTESAGGRLIAPMPGRIVAVLVAPGDRVEKGRPLVVLEAMKMEHTVSAPADGTVARVPFATGDQVEEGTELVGFEADP